MLKLQTSKLWLRSLDSGLGVADYVMTGHPRVLAVEEAPAQEPSNHGQNLEKERYQYAGRVLGNYRNIDRKSVTCDF